MHATESLDAMVSEQERGFQMLVLSRKVGEQLMIGDDVTVTVLSVRGNQVRIGVTAPKEVPVLREELIDNASEKPSTTRPLQQVNYARRSYVLPPE